MAANRNLEKQPEEQLRAIFETTVSTIHRAIGVGAFRPKAAVNAAVLDSIMVGVASRQTSGPITSDEKFKVAYKQLFANSQYQEATTRSTADEENVRKRVQLAKDAFAKVP